MLKNYLKVAIRNVRRRKGYAAVNVIGLSLGIAAAVLIALYARHELTYDGFHTHTDRIYQVYKERVTPTDTQVTRDTWVPLLARLERTYPSVENGVRMFSEDQWVQHEDERFQEQITYTDASLFDVFSFPLVRGDAVTALRDPHSVVITQEIARKFFGDADPLGQMLTVNNDVEYTVRGVFAEIPSNTVFDISLAVPLVSDPDYEAFSDNWDTSFLGTFILLSEQADPTALEAQFPTLIADVWDAEVAARTNFKLEALPDLYDALTGSRTYAYILLAIALATILIACINFMNLATARSLERAKEIGMRKALGAGRRQLVGQILSESLLMSFVALALGVALAHLLLPVFNDLYEIELQLGLLRDPWIPAVLIGLGLAVGVLSGSYPALFLSRFAPSESLRGTSRRPGGLRLRHGLVVFQFALSILLIAGTGVMGKQIQHMKNRDLAFDQEHVLVLPVALDDFADQEAATLRLQTFKDELARLSDVRSVTSSARVPGDGYGSFVFATPEGGNEEPHRLRWTAQDEHFFGTYGIRFVEGRDFLADSESDREQAIILNEAAVRDFGWREAVGKTVRAGGGERRVIGVVEDYNYESLLNEVAPLIHLYRPPDGGVHDFISVKIQSADYPATLARIEQAWHRLDPSRAFDYAFVDARFDQLYRTQDRLLAVAGTFAVLAILIACLGLFGLASLTVAQRTKEIGVRKVLGASVDSIVVLLTKDFLRLVLGAFVVAAPIAYLAMSRWLAGFAYRVEIGPGVFALAGFIALAVALLTVSYHAVRAATTDPVKALRYE